MTDINPRPYEERFQTMGMMNGDVILIVHTFIHTFNHTFNEAAFTQAQFTTKTDAGELISARKATPQGSRICREGAF